MCLSLFYYHTVLIIVASYVVSYEIRKCETFSSEVCLHALLPVAEAAAREHTRGLGVIRLAHRIQLRPSWGVISGRPLNIFRPQFPDI